VSDDDHRRLERAWRAHPTDQRALAELMAALRRARRPVSGELLEAVVQSARRVKTRRAVRAELPDGRRVGAPEAPNGRWVELPACRAWWLEAAVNRELPLEALLRDAREAGATGLQVGVHPEVRGTVGAGLASLPELERVRASGSFTDEDLAALAACETLVVLELVDCQRLTAAGLAPLMRLPRLSELSLERCRLGNEVVPLLNALPGLTRLRLDRTQVTGRGLADLDLPLLRQLSAAWCALRPEQLDDALGALPSLVEVDARWTGLGGDERRGVRLVTTDPRLEVATLTESPTLGEGTVAGAPWTFRAKYQRWSFTLGGPRVFERSGAWGPEEYAAPLESAEARILESAMEYLATCSPEAADGT
jgi:hypothetical protein